MISGQESTPNPIGDAENGPSKLEIIDKQIDLVKMEME